MNHLDYTNKLDRSSDDLEEYFREDKKRIRSQIYVVTELILPKVPENETNSGRYSQTNYVNGDIFNLNSINKESYLLNPSDDCLKKYSKKHKKSKKSSKKRRRSGSRSSKRHIKSEKKSTNKSHFDDKQSVKSISSVSSTENFDFVEQPNFQNVITPPLPEEDKKIEPELKRQSLENRLEKFTFPQTQTNQTNNLPNGSSNDYSRNQIKPIVNHFTTFNQSYNQYYNNNRFDQYNFLNYQLKKPNNLIVIEPKREVFDIDIRHKSLVENTHVENKKEILDRKSVDNNCVQQISKEIKTSLVTMQVSLAKNDVQDLVPKEKILEEKTNRISVNNEDDLEALRNKFRMQLEERLFDKNDRSLLEEIRREQIRNQEKSSSKDTNLNETRSSVDSDSARKSSRSHKEKKKKIKDKHKRHHKSLRKEKHKKITRKREKKRSKSDDEDDEETNDEDSIDNFDELTNAMIRRSDRIKVIETKKQYNKELEIAEKVKKMSSVNTNDSDRVQNGQDFEITKESFCDSPKNNEMSSPLKSVININKTSDTANSLALNTDCDSNSEVKVEWPSGFEQIDENLYHCKRQNNKNKESKKMVCDCTYSEQERQLGMVACGSDCLNRMLLIECGNRCPCGEFCTNRNFKMKNNAKMLPFNTINKGWGLKTTVDLKAETFLIEYVGEVIDLKEFKKRCEKYSEQNNQHFYFMALQNDLFIDATKKGNVSRFFNHSCDPNCETQKWTVNGELRIGFFTRRPVKPNEELTFDYQFQTVGKKQQKCYCGSEKCRGFLGASSNTQSNQLDYIWNTDSEAENSNSELSVEESPTESESEIDDKENKSNIKKEKIRKNKKQRENKDFDLNRQIKSIRSLSNKENVLKLCQLMFRTENLEMRLDILDLLLNTKAEISLRLFIDYHGLKLLWSWMIDIDNKNESIEHLECKLKILDVLSMLSIKNRSVLEECKLLVLVKRWSESENRIKFNISEDSQSNSEDLETKVWIEKILDKLIDNVFVESEKKSDENHQNFVLLFNELKSKAKILYDEWNNLKIAFKIPKKQQIEERKEHERELNEFSKEQEKSNINSDETFSSQNPVYNQAYSGYRNNFRYKNFNRFNGPKPFYKSRFNPITSNPTLTKEQRRQLFEQKVKEEEEKAATEAAARAAAEAEAKAKQFQKQEMKWVYDSHNNKWVQCYVQIPINPQHQFYPQPINPVSYQLNTFDQYSYGVPPPPPPPPLPSQPTPASNSTEILNKINLTDSNLKNLQQALQQITHSVQDTPKKEELSAKKVPLSASKHRSMAAIAAKLPPGWKCKRNNKGFIYYYNIKTKKTQWNFPRISKASTNLKSKLDVLDEKQEAVKMNQEIVENEKCEVVEKISPAVTSTTTEKVEQDLTKSNNSETASVSGSVTTSSNTFKIHRDQFREKLSKFIVKLLEPFLKKECKYGHIKNSEDFKHLARKFTHTIMEKEISRATNLEELELDKRIKVKAQDYVGKYMQKFRDGYSRSIDTF